MALMRAGRGSAASTITAMAGFIGMGRMSRRRDLSALLGRMVFQIGTTPITYVEIAAVLHPTTLKQFHRESILCGVNLRQH